VRPSPHQVRIAVQRERLFDTAFAALSPVRGEALRRKVYVSFVNAQGMDEAGIDAGGLFKELWTSLAAIAFDPRFGMWAVTDRGELYPNPSSALFSGLPDDVAFEFVGRVLGKALYEGITVGPQFARFFLVKLLGRPATLHHLPSLDLELYKSLMFLKSYDGDVADLCLTFTISRDLAGGGGGGGSSESDEAELVPGGRDIPVTARNRMQVRGRAVQASQVVDCARCLANPLFSLLQYIYAVADWRLNQAISRQSAALLRGLREVLPAGWLAPFSAPELQARAQRSSVFLAAVPFLSPHPSLQPPFLFCTAHPLFPAGPDQRESRGSRYRRLAQAHCLRGRLHLT
jgi:ubiquitin-protein ligase E3 C